jgi:hypothetical protein
VAVLDKFPGLIGLCAGFENNEWRCKQLAGYLIEWLPEFALKEREKRSIDSANMVAILAKAARLVYGNVNPNDRGEIGEILLHAAIRQEFGSIPAISKIYFKDSENEAIKGYDAVHIVTNADGNFELWLGEAKFYKNISSAIFDVVKELKEHTGKEFLRGEFAAIINKIESDWHHAEKLKDLIGRNKSLDIIFESLCIPVFLTYESDTIKSHKAVTEEYEKAIIEEFQKHHATFCGKELPDNIKVHLFLLPLKNKEELINEFDERLKACQKLTN